MFDTHVHLNSDKYKDDLIEVINNARNAGIEYLICVGWDIKSSKDAVSLAEQYDFIYAAVGIHPTDVNDLTDADFKELSTLLDHRKVVALGEIGLDYHWDVTSKEDQNKYFRKQIKLAQEKNKPIIIHSRDAIEDTYNILKEENIQNIGGVMHCYSSSVEMSEKFLELGLYISLGGPVTFKNAKHSKKVAETINLNRLLVETDCPYLTPHPNRGKRNEPTYVELVVQEIAKLRDMTKEDVEKITTENSKCLFRIK